LEDLGEFDNFANWNKSQIGTDEELQGPKLPSSKLSVPGLSKIFAKCQNSTQFGLVSQIGACCDHFHEMTLK